MVQGRLDGAFHELEDFADHRIIFHLVQIFRYQDDRGLHYLVVVVPQVGDYVGFEVQELVGEVVKERLDPLHGVEHCLRLGMLGNHRFEEGKNLGEKIIAIRLVEVRGPWGDLEDVHNLALEQIVDLQSLRLDVLVILF